MQFNRRQLLAGVAATSLLNGRAKAWLHPGKAFIGTGWNTLPLGAGGELWGLHIANDGAMVCRGDVDGGYVWSGTSDLSSINDPTQKWSQVCNFTALGSNFTGTVTHPAQPWEYVQAPGNSQYHYLMTGDVTNSGKYFLYYSVDKGVHFTKSTLSMSQTGQNTTQSKSGGYYKIAADPNNEKIVYVGMCQNNGNPTSVYTTFDRALGQTWPNFTTAFTDLAGTTMFPQVTAGLVDGVCGIAFDTSLGTTTINGEIVTKRIILGVGGQGVFETTDGGLSWANITPPAFVANSSYLYQGMFDGDTNANLVKNYFCNFLGLKKVYRYVGGGVSGWTDISPAGFAGQNPSVLTVDPRPGAVGSGGGVGRLTVAGPNGITNGFSTTTATQPTPSWAGSTAPRNVTLRGSPNDIGYMDHLFGQGASVGFTDGIASIIDMNGTNFWCGNQSIWYFSAIPNWGISTTSTSFSFGRGQESVVACDVIRPPGAPYPIIACQDVGAPMLGGTFISYPTSMVRPLKESTCQNLDRAPNNPSFIVARMTGQPTQGDPLGDYSSFTSDFGFTWNTINGTPTALWQATVNATVSGAIMTVSSFVSGNFVMPTQSANDGTSNPPFVLEYGVAGTNGVGGAGTYALSKTSTFGATIDLSAPITAGQTMPVDEDHWVTVPNYNGTEYVPAYTTNARAVIGIGGPTTSWALCQKGVASGGGNMPANNYMVRGGWSFGATSKPIAAGYGTDLGTVWIAHYPYDSTTGGEATGSVCFIDDGSGGGSPSGIAGNVLTVGGSVGPNPWKVGQLVSAGSGGVAANTTIVNQLTGLSGQAGTYTVSGSAQLVGSRSMIAQTNPAIITLWRSNDYGATFDSVATTTGQANGQGIYLLAVPGFPDELWLGVGITSGNSCLWHITGARTAPSPTITPMTGTNLPSGSPSRTILQTLSLGAPSSPGGYPLLYGTFQQNGVGSVPAWLYQGVWNAGAGTLTWSLYGPPGTNQGRNDQLPQSMQMNGIGFIRGDWNVPGRIYVGNNGLGFAYYNP